MTTTETVHSESVTTCWALQRVPRWRWKSLEGGGLGLVNAQLASTT